MVPVSMHFNIYILSLMYSNKKRYIPAVGNATFFGASEGTRTPMHKAQDPKSCASTNSATLACGLINIIIMAKRRLVNY